MNIVYMGTPDIAVSVLKKVMELPVSVTAVYTQPDAAVGRSRTLQSPPMKRFALSQGIPVFQPRRVKKPEETERLFRMHPDLIMVTAYGQILSEEILQIPRLGCINMHASLLPRYRGAAPVQWAIVNGEEETGVTTMMMDKGMDTGDILLQEKVPISPDETEETLLEKLSASGAALMKETVSRLLSGQTIKRTPQDPEKATYAPIIRKEDALIHWEKSAWQTDCLVRGFSAWPCAYTYLGGQKITVRKACVLTKEQTQEALVPGLVGEDAASFLAAAPGAFVCGGTAKKPRLLVACGTGVLEILRLQPAGKKEMDAASFLRGLRIQKGNFHVV